MTLPFMRAARTFHLLLVDDDPGIRFMLHATLDRHPALHVAAEASNGVDAVSLVERIHPDAAILGVQMPFMDGLTAAKHMKRISPDTRIVIFSAITAPAFIDRALSAGADLYLSKMTPPNEVADAVVGACATPVSAVWHNTA